MNLQGDPSWVHDLVRLLSMQDANTRTALIGTGLLGLASGVVGVFAMFRRRALVGDAIAHAALPGVCIAFLIVGSKSFAALLAGALVIGLVAAWCISVVRSVTRIKEDAITAIVIGVFFGMGIVLLSRIQSMPTGNQAGLEGFLFGKAASMVAADARAIAVVAGVVLVAVALAFKELRSLCFDRVFSEAIGYPVKWLDLGLMALVCLCTIAGLPAVGVVLVVAMLTIPAAAARFWSDRLNVVVVLAGLIGALSGVMGTALSAVVPAPDGAGTRGWATGPVIVLCAGVVFVVSAVAAPKRGVLAELVRDARARREFAGAKGGAL